MSYDRIIRDALRLARAPRRFASGGETRKPSNRDENFRNWFGNSKAIDGEGKPWVHYHATSKHFSEFIPGGHDPSLSGPAIWLTPHKHNQPAAHNVMRRGEFKEGANVMPLYVKIENPLYVTNSDREEKAELAKKFGSKSYGWPMTLHPDDVKKMKDAGYDGIFHINDYSDVKFNPETGEGLETIVFDPSQLKSAIGNSGEFNPNSHDITKSHGGMTGYASGGGIDPNDISPSISNPVSVFPKPQRMFPSDAPIPGGQYLGMPDKQDMTGHKSAAASIGVHPGGKPYFNASRDAVDQTGTAGKAKVKTNLFKQKAGWSWQAAPEGHEDTSTIVSVEHRGKHYYTLNAHFPKGVDFARYAESRSEPRLRPTTTGDVFLGPQAGTISVRGKQHPVYHHVVVKADGGAVGYASGGDTTPPRQLNDMGFYSSAVESARSLPQSKGTPQQMLATMKGVKPAELEWSGVQDKFAGQKSVTKDDLAEHFEQNVPQIKETVLGVKKEKNNMPTRQEVRNEYEPKLLYYNDIDEKYNSMIEDGKGHLLTEKDHEEYQHALSEMDRLTIEMDEKLEEIEGNEYDNTKYSEYTVGNRYGNSYPSQRNYREVLLHLPGEKKFQSPHWEPENILAHLRMQDRGPDNDILHLEELQSDWAQKGRDGGFDTKEMKEKREFAKNEFNNFSKELAEKYGLNPKQNLAMYGRIKGMSDDEVEKYEKLQSEVSKLDIFKSNYIEPAPYVTNTDHWMELGLKRALLESARGGYNKLVWTPGEEQAKRYDLSKRISRVAYNSKTGDLAYVQKSIFDEPDDNIIDNLQQYPESVKPEKLSSFIGRELSEKLLASQPSNSGWHELGGLDLEIGGEGMKSFYGKMLPAALRRVLKPHTDKIQPTSHVVKGNDGEDVTLPGIEITPEMRESILKKGFSYYARGGEVRQHFDVGGGADSGSDSDGGFEGSGGGGDSAPEATQDSPAFSTEAPPSYSPPESDPSMLGGATGMAFSPSGSGSLGVGTGNTSGSFLGAAEQQLNTGPGIVGFLGGTPMGLMALGAEKLNEAARAQGYDVVDPGGARPGRGTEQAAREQAAYEAGFPGNRAGGNDSGMIPDPVAPEPSFYGFRLSNDDEETQAGMVRPVGFTPPKPPMMASGGSVPMASGGETGDNSPMPMTPDQQRMLDDLSAALDRAAARYGTTGYAADPAAQQSPAPRHEPTMPGEPALTRGQEQEYHIGQLQNALARVPTDYPTGPVGYAEGGDVEDNPAVQKALAVTSGVPVTSGAAANFIQNTSNPKRIMVPATGPGGIKGIVIPRHMWEGGNGGKHGLIPGLRDINQARAAVYGSQNRDPLTIGKVAEIHKQTLDEHFKRPVDEQIARENEALERLRAAKHIGKSSDTLDESEKLDTVRHEYDDQGRPHVGYGSKGVAGYALYSSGHGPNQKFHVLNVCPGSVAGCSGGIDANGIADTSRGTCFAPVAESQYPGAAIRRACHAQAKFDPAMTSDWILSHTGSLRRAAERADKNGERVLFRPNVVDESDRSSRYAIKYLNDQRKAYSESAKLNLPLPDIIANSYGKTTELHDPDNGFFVTYSNTGPKTKLGYSVSENIQRDRQRVRSTILAQDAAGRDFVNDDGEETPPKGSYMVTDVKRDSPLDEKMRKAFKYAKYWSVGRPVSSLSKDEAAEGEEAHYDGKGKPTTPEKAHYGHVTLNGKRYDYQKQHILHRRLVQVGKNKDGSPHMIPTDSRFKDEEFLPSTRYMTRSGKPAGHILITTPTTSTSNAGHQTAFTHHVNESHIAHASKNKGEYEIDPPAAQEASAGKEYAPPKDVGHFAYGGTVDDEIGEHLMAFPERSHYAQIHNVHRSRHNDEREIGSKRSHGIKSIDRALRLTSQYNQPTRGRP